MISAHTRFRKDWKNMDRNSLNPLTANPTKWSNTLKQFVGNLTMNCLSEFDRFVGLALKGLSSSSQLFRREAFLEIMGNSKQIILGGVCLKKQLKQICY